MEIDEDLAEKPLKIDDAIVTPGQILTDDMSFMRFRMLTKWTWNVYFE
jgi:hypothetical protein